MKKILIKILCMLLVAICIISITNVSSAESGKTLVEYFDGDTSGEGKIKTEIDTSGGENLIVKVIGPVLSVIRIVATAIALIVLTFLGMKYMSAAPSEKASIKNQLVTFTIGAVVVVGTTSLLDIIKNFAQGI